MQILSYLRSHLHRPVPRQLGLCIGHDELYFWHGHGCDASEILIQKHEVVDSRLREALSHGTATPSHWSVQNESVITGKQRELKQLKFHCEQFYTSVSSFKIFHCFPLLVRVGFALGDTLEKVGTIVTPSVSSFVGPSTDDKICLHTG